MSATPDFVPKHQRIVDSKSFLALSRLPQNLIVLGGGYIGCEIASMAAMLGVKVTIVELLDDILMLLDADLRKEVRAHMEKTLGVRVLTGVAAQEYLPPTRRACAATSAAKRCAPTSCSTRSAASR